MPKGEYNILKLYCTKN